MTDPVRNGSARIVLAADDALGEVLGSVVEQAPNLIILAEFSGTVVFVNGAGVRLLDMPTPPNPDLRVSDLLTPAGRTATTDAASTLRSTGRWEGRAELRRHSSDAPVQVSVSAFVLRRSDAPDLVVAMARDLTRGHPGPADLDERVQRRSTHDPLTGLPDRTLAYAAVDDALTRVRELGERVALLLLDIDDFGIINDSLGHASGDRALVRFADRLVAAVRTHDAVYRFGGDEFLVVCSGFDDPRHAEDLAFRISTALTTPPSPSDTTADAPIPMSASIGIAVSEPGTTVRELLRRADLALHRAKDGGGGAHAVYDAENDHYDADRVRSLSVDLRAALGRDELTLAYQPLVHIATGEVVSVEALARWNHPVLGQIDPSEFVAVAERTGLAAVLGDWALRTACRQAAMWRRNFSITVRVNVSALQLRDPTFPGRVASVLRESRLPPQALGLEVTETVWLADTGRVARNLTAVHEMGVALLLDDVGAGHSSLSYLERFPVFECFKIDKGYIDALDTPRGRAVVTAIVALAKAYEMTVVGEGVETRAQLDALAETGCDLAQGFLLGRPVDADHTGELLRERASRSSVT